MFSLIVSLLGSKCSASETLTTSFCWFLHCSDNFLLLALFLSQLTLTQSPCPVLWRWFYNRQWEVPHSSSRWGRNPTPVLVNSMLVKLICLVNAGLPSPSPPTSPALPRFWSKQTRQRNIRHIHTMTHYLLLMTGEPGIHIWLGLVF